MDGMLMGNDNELQKYFFLCTLTARDVEQNKIGVLYIYSIFDFFSTLK